MIEECNCGGGYHTWLRETCVSLECPLPPYIKEGGREAGPLGARQVYGVLLGLPSPSRNAFPFRSRREGRREGVGKGKGAPPPSPSPIRTHGGGNHLPFGLPPPFSYGPIRPVTSSGSSGNPRYSETYRKRPEPFRCPNVIFQYMNLYVSTISRLLVTYVISSVTPNNVRYIKSHNS